MPGSLSMPTDLLPSFDVEASIAATYRQNAEGAVKTVEDLDRYRMVIEATRPDVIIECGTFRGASAVWFVAQGVDVVTIDQIVSEANFGLVFEPRATLIVGDSTDPDVVAQAAELVAGRRTMVVLDSDHHAEHVRREIIRYGPVVTSGCYLVVEDGIVRFPLPHLWPDGVPGPLDAIEDLLVDNPDWVRDEAVEGLYPVTMSPLGWWRRA
jgi:cephalosporin hydroxylase